MTETEADSKREGKNHEVQPLNISLSVGGKVLGINPTYNTGAQQKIRFKVYQAQSYLVMSNILFDRWLLFRYSAEYFGPDIL